MRSVRLPCRPPSDIAARLEKPRHNSKNHIFVAEIPFQTGENNTVAGFISFESYETIYCNAGINNPDASVGVVVLIRWLQSALIPFVTTQGRGIKASARINITGFVVDEKARKTGIGRSLMKAVEFYAERNGFHLYARSQVQHGKMRIKHTENSVLIPKRVRFAF